MLFGNELVYVGNTQSEKTKKLLEDKNKFVARGISASVPIFVEEAKGAVLKDIDGNIFLDFYGGIGVINAGHCPEPVVNALQEQSEKYLHTCFMVTMYEPYLKLAEKLVEITPGNFEKKVMFVNSGAEAVENAIKIAKAYTNKSGIIAFESAFHGRTLMTMSLTSKVKPYKYGFGPYAPEIYRAPSAYCYRCMYNSTYPDCGMHCLEHFDRFFVSQVDPANIAAMIIEPVQGEGGFVVPPPEFLQGLKEICKRNEIVFIVDEVQTGFARTGKLFAVENFGIDADLITMAKSIASGIPLSAVVGKAEIMDAPDPGHIGGTYGGNPLACVAGLETIKYIEEEDLSGRAQQIGAYTVNRLKELQEKYYQFGDIRALGAMVAVEFVKNAQTKEPSKEETGRVIAECRKRGLLLIGAGIYGNVIRMLTPLVITDEQLKQALDIFETACNEVFAE